MKFINTTKLIGLLALLVFLCPSCKDDDKINPDDGCEKFPEIDDGPSIIGPIVQKPYQRKAPCFNPNNNNEFAYVKTENNIQTLVRYNLENEEEHILAENVDIIGQPNWGQNNKIVFVEQYQLKLIDHKSTSNIKSLTSENYHLYPKWRNDTTIIAEFSFNLGRPYFQMNLNSNSLKFDTIRNQTFTMGTINEDENFAFIEYRDEPDITITQNSNSSELTNKSFTGFNRIEGLCWLGTEDVIYSTYRTGIFKINTTNKQETLIKNSCDTRSYRYLSISSDGIKILAERVDATDFNTEDGGWTEESKIVIMDIDGSNERVLFE
jgi:hypothetical protein